MTTVEIDQFLIDHHREGEVIEVDCSWLQKQLKQKLLLQRELEFYPARRLSYEARISVLEEKLELYKELLETYRNRKVLNTYV